jgi:hypothetical protein
MIVVDKARERRRIIARRQRTARRMFLAGLPLHVIRQALGVITRKPKNDV